MKPESDLLLRLLISLAIFTALTLLVSFTALAEGPASAAGTTPGELLAVLERIQEERLDLSARFHQVREIPLAGRRIEAEGEVWFQQPDRLRVRYTSPQESEIVVNGKNVWISSPARGEVQHFDLDRRVNLSALLLALGSNRFDVGGTFELRPSNGNGTRRGVRAFTLVPGPGSQLSGEVERIEMALDAESDLPLHVSVYGISGDLLDVELEDIAINTGLADDQFEFTSPPGAQVMDYSTPQ